MRAATCGDSWPQRREFGAGRQLGKIVFPAYHHSPLIDLHVHSTASDGELAPAAVVRHAKGRGLSALALTDHDTTAGVPEAQAAGVEEGLEVIPGVEISLDMEPGTFHMIGLFVDLDHAPLQDGLERVRSGRNRRNVQIAERLSEMGMPVRMRDVTALAGGEVVARPHFARLMVESGYVGSVMEAFRRFLGKGRPAYVDRLRLDVGEAIQLIRDAGGVSVLCHPHTLGLKDEAATLPPLLETWAGLGLDAMEVLYGDNTKNAVRVYREMARAAGLLESGGSDFHGFKGRKAKMGIGGGGRPIPPVVMEMLRERAQSR